MNDEKYKLTVYKLIDKITKEECLLLAETLHELQKNEIYHVNCDIELLETREYTWNEIINF